MAIRLDGKKTSDKLMRQLQQEVAALARQNIIPTLAVVLVGEDSASQIYVRNKQKRAAQLGIHSVRIDLPDTITQAALLAQVEALNEDPEIDGILVQLPLPAGLDAKAVIEAIAPDKDVDGFSPVNVGRLWTNEPGGVIASTPYGIMQLLDAYDINVAGQNVVIVGRSTIVGRPLAGLMLNRDATVTIAHSQTRALFDLTHTADILVAAIGQPQFFHEDAVKPGAVVIDVGMNRLANGKLVGDVDFESVAPIASAITPVPGGVGPMTIAALMTQTVALAKRHHHG